MHLEDQRWAPRTSMPRYAKQCVQRRPLHIQPPWCFHQRRSSLAGNSPGQTKHNWRQEVNVHPLSFSCTWISRDKLYSPSSADSIILVNEVLGASQTSPSGFKHMHHVSTLSFFPDVIWLRKFHWNFCIQLVSMAYQLMFADSQTTLALKTMQASMKPHGMHISHWVHQSTILSA